MVHRIVVEDQSLRWYGRPPKIADDSIEFVQLQFHLPEDWEPLLLVAQFTQAGTYNKLLEEGKCFLPVELTAGLCKVSLFGYAGGEPLRATSIPLVFQIEESGFVSSAETPIPPTPDLYAQLIEYFSSIAGSSGGSSGSGTINPEDVAAAVEDYLSKNPPEVPDLSDEVAQAELAAKVAKEAAASANTAMTTTNVYRANAKTSETNAANSATRAEDAAKRAEEAAASIPEFGNGNAGHVVQDTAPEDTSVLWVDPTDNSDDGFQEAVNAALAQAKASGEFDGKDGYTPQKNVDYFDGKDGYTPQKGKDYFDGNDYVLTPADKEEIAELAAGLVEVPEGSGGGIASGGEWELIGEVISDGNGDSNGLYLAVDFKAYKDMHVEAVETSDAIAFRLVVSKTKNWYDGQILVNRNDTGVQMHSAFIWVIDGRLKIISGSNSGYSADGRIELNNTPRNFFLTDDFNFVRFDANGGIVPAGATLKVWGRK